MHIAFEVTEEDLKKLYNKGLKLGIDTRGIIDHGFISSIYFRDPNGYVIELTYPKQKLDNSSYYNNLSILKKWQNKKIND